MPWPLKSCPRRESRSESAPLFPILIARLSSNPLTQPPLPSTSSWRPIRLHEARFRAARRASKRQSAPEVNLAFRIIAEGWLSVTGSAVFHWNLSFCLCFSLSLPRRAIKRDFSTLEFGESAPFRFIFVYQSLSRPLSSCSSISPDIRLLT